VLSERDIIVDNPNLRGSPLPVDLIRTFAIVLVILLHASEENFPITAIVNQEVVIRWWSITIYNSLSRECVPLFVMLSGALLLQSYKIEEPLKPFFKKRLLRIGLPWIFWGAAYFAWSYLVKNNPVTFNSIAQGIATGPYYQFWFLYMLLGLYLVTPLLRVLIARANRSVIRYFLLLWFVGSAVIPFINLFMPIGLSSNVFLLTGWIGYFLLGLYLLETQVRAKFLFVILMIGYIWTAVGTYLITYFVGGQTQYFFYGFLTANVILVSAALFLLLKNVPASYIQKKSPTANRLLHFVSQCSLAIFLLHVVILESLQNGYFGFRISITSMNPIYEIPLITVVTLLICLAILYPVSKISGLRKIVGISD
jgi:surface polysaccharide O-acyltransferase-like enzyme